MPEEISGDGYNGRVPAASVMSFLSALAGIGFSFYVWEAVLDRGRGNNWAALAVLVLFLPFGALQVISWVLVLLYRSDDPAGARGSRRAAMFAGVVVGTGAPMATWAIAEIYEALAA
jgi:hypothetical protein